METETLNEFIIDMMDLYYKINPNMTEDENCEEILVGLPGKMYNKIEILDNSNITKLTENQKKIRISNNY